MGTSKFVWVVVALCCAAVLSTLLTSRGLLTESSASINGRLHARNTLGHMGVPQRQERGNAPPLLVSVAEQQPTPGRRRITDKEREQMARWPDTCRSTDAMAVSRNNATGMVILEPRGWLKELWKGDEKRVVPPGHLRDCIEYEEHPKDRFSLLSKAFCSDQSKWQLTGQMNVNLQYPDENIGVVARRFPEWVRSAQQELTLVHSENTGKRKQKYRRGPSRCVTMGSEYLDLSKLRNVMRECDIFSHECHLMRGNNAIAPRPFHDGNVDKAMLYRLEDTMHSILRFPWMAEGPLREAMLDIFDQLGIAEEQVVHGMIARLMPQRFITRHRDTGIWTQVARRVHVVVDTHEDIWFLLSTQTAEPIHGSLDPTKIFDKGYVPSVRIPAFKAGMWFELNNRCEHEVINANSELSRTHIIFDYIDESVPPLDRVWDIPHNATCVEGSKETKKRTVEQCRELLGLLVASEYGQFQPSLLHLRVLRDIFGENSTKFSESMTAAAKFCSEFEAKVPTCDLPMQPTWYGADRLSLNV